MSRSYRKFPSCSPNGEFIPHEWKHFREQERQCVHREMMAVDHGETLFPRYYPANEKSWVSTHRCYLSIKEIRDTYYTEINHILNDFHSRRPREAYREKFLNNFNSMDGSGVFDFEWLNHHGVKKVIKRWEGEPLDVLYYLQQQGLIEMAVRKAYKAYKRKD
ncbi:hypothetical protein LQZ19_15960 [Treponema primitia]|uniref:hypothetical protein n=1 Tax=Treponema primitia TaxID=88058 RepID=UPI00398029F0